MIRFFQNIINTILNIGTHHATGIDEKAKIRVVNLSILHALMSTMVVVWLITELKLYLFTYLGYICSLFFMLYLIHIGKFNTVRYIIYYVTLTYLSILSIASKGELLVEYIIIIAIVIAYADFHEKNSTIMPTITGLVCFAVIQAMNYYDVVDYPLPKHKEIIFFINLAVIIALLSNALTELRREIYKYKDDIQEKNNELISKSQALIEADTLKNRLFSIIGHDLRQPFNSIQGLMELLESESLDDATRISIVKRIRLSNKNALSTLENLLHWGISMQKEEDHLQQSIQVSSGVRNVFDVLSETAENKKISLESAVDDDVKVWVNPDHFDLVLRNLISNAIKFSYPEGKILVTGKYHPKMESFEIMISDTGIGMSKAQIDKLFDKMYISSTKGTAQEKGTGLGMMLCKEFIEQNQGSIEINSEEGRGTTISVFLKTQKGTFFAIDTPNRNV